MNHLTYEFIQGDDVIQLSNDRTAYKRTDGDYETMDRHQNIDGVYKIVLGTNWAEKIA